MNAEELIEALNGVPGDMPVVILGGDEVFPSKINTISLQENVHCFNSYHEEAVVLS